MNRATAIMPMNRSRRQGIAGNLLSMLVSHPREVRYFEKGKRGWTFAPRWGFRSLNPQPEACERLGYGRSQQLLQDQFAQFSAITVGHKRAPPRRGGNGQTVRASRARVQHSDLTGCLATWRPDSIGSQGLPTISSKRGNDLASLRPA